MITALELLPGNAWDSAGALELVERSEAGAGVPVTEAMGDAAYGDGGTRQAFAGAGRTLIAKAPGRPNTARFPKEDFRRTSGGLPDFRRTSGLTWRPAPVRPGRLPAGCARRSGALT